MRKWINGTILQTHIGGHFEKYLGLFRYHREISYLSVTHQMSTFEMLCRLSTGYTLETPEFVDSGTNFELSLLQNMLTSLNFGKNV